MMDNSTPKPEPISSLPEINQAEIDQLLRDMNGNWGVDVIETVIDTPYLMVTTDNGLEAGDLYGGEFFSASERVVETLPESQLIDAMWSEDSQPMAILDTDQFPDLGLNSFDRHLVDGLEGAAPVTIDAVNLAKEPVHTPEISERQMIAPVPVSLEQNNADLDALLPSDQAEAQAHSEASHSAHPKRFFVPPLWAGTRLKF
ncbi:MAG: hypothetical protein ORN98_08450 [Alphaproteobacteria bacterium]|nr:hypothetical protein [Alphaproteobacteria bacterium]